MIKPFNHRSPVIHVVEGLAVAGLISMALRMIPQPMNWLAWLLYAVVIVLYGFIRFCTTKRWYKPVRRSSGGGGARYEGIELQFKKALSPTVYITFLGSLLFIVFPSAIVLGVMAFMLAVIAHVNIILLYLKRRDTQDLPVNYFSGNKADKP